MSSRHHNSLSVVESGHGTELIWRKQIIFQPNPQFSFLFHRCCLNHYLTMISWTFNPKLTISCSSSVSRVHDSTSAPNGQEGEVVTRFCVSAVLHEYYTIVAVDLNPARTSTYSCGIGRIMYEWNWMWVERKEQSEGAVSDYSLKFVAVNSLNILITSDYESFALSTTRLSTSFFFLLISTSVSWFGIGEMPSK